MVVTPGSRWAEDGFPGGGNIQKTSSLKDGLITFTDVADPANIYVGQARAGSLTTEPAWRIKKVTIDSQLIASGFAQGDVQNFDKIWDDRASYYYD